jgi:hypothetical protein
MNMSGMASDNQALELSLFAFADPTSASAITMTVPPPAGRYCLRTRVSPRLPKIVNGVDPSLPGECYQPVLPAFIRGNGDRVREDRNQIQEPCPALARSADAFQGNNCGTGMNIETVGLENQPAICQVEPAANGLDAPLQVGSAVLDKGLTGK